MLEISLDGRDWMQEQHPKRGFAASGGIELAHSPEQLAARVPARRVAAPAADNRHDWEQLWARVTVWDHQAAADATPADQAPQRPEHILAELADARDPAPAAAEYAMCGRFLQAWRVEPDVIDGLTPLLSWHRHSVVWCDIPGRLSQGHAALDTCPRSGHFAQSVVGFVRL